MPDSLEWNFQINLILNYSWGLFDAHKYVNDSKIAKVKIKNLAKVDAERIEQDMYDNYTPQIINVQHTLPWIKTKFEMAMQIKNNWNILEGEEYKLLEDLCVDRDWRMFIPLPIEFDDKLIMEMQKSNYLLIKNQQKSNKMEEIDKEIEKFKKLTPKQLFLPSNDHHRFSEHYITGNFSDGQ